MRRNTTALWLFLGYGAFVVYGSLVPLEFKGLPLDEAWQRFQHIPFLTLGLDSRADWVANGVLYAPLAFWGARAASSLGLAQPLAVALSMLCCAALAVGVEFTQVFFPARTVSQNDILAECIGSVVGAAAAPFLAGWMDRLGPALRSGGTRMLPRLLELYAAVYLLLCFFPYDLLLSASELQLKVDGVGWGWWLAPHPRGLFFSALQWAVEVALALPFGVLLVSFRRPVAGPAAPAAPWGLALLAGAALGLFIEAGQFFVASGVSQGASVLSRALGVAAGAALLPWLRVAGLTGLRDVLRRLAPIAWVFYLPLLAVVSGLFGTPWHDAAGALQSWHETHLLPFYYHYYTTEALAMVSLGSVAILYLPVAVLGWARGWSLRTRLLTAALLATAFEAAKVFVSTLHADPTNVLVALAVVALASALLGLAERQTGVAAGPAGSPAERPVQPAALLAARPTALPGARPAALPGALPAELPGAPPGALPAAPQADAAPQRLGSAWLLALPPALLMAALFPTLPLLLLALLVGVAVAVWRWPLLALGLVPAAMPVLDLAPWSGRLYWDEFDLLQMVCLAVALHRTRGAGPRSRRQPFSGLTLAFALLGLSLALSTLRGLAPLWPPAWPDANSFAGYYSPYNALRIVKGALWAWLFVMLWRRLEASGAARARAFGAGITVGLALTVAVVVWERAIFASIWDFAVRFRVTGGISAMHKGGAYIECFIAIGAAFVLQQIVQARQVAVRELLLLLLAGAGYAMMVTYSRNGYGALALVFGLSLLPLARGLFRRGAAASVLAQSALLALLFLAVALPIAGGVYARQRLALSSADLQVRQAHWADGLLLRDASLATDLLGMGIGRFPEAHFWRSAEPVHAGSYQLGRDASGAYLKLGQGAALFVDQTIPWPDDAELTLSLELRGPKGPSDLTAALCEKWTLTSLRCVEARFDARPAAAGGWQAVTAPLALARLRAGNELVHAPLRLSLLTPDKGVVDVTRLRLTTPGGVDLLRNGDFSRGMDHWFFSTDIDPPWHLHSLPVAVLFDQGWLGVAAWAAVLLLACGRGGVLVWRGQAQSPAAWAALGGFMVSASVNTLIDAPRFLWLLLVLAWLAAAPEALPAVGRRPRRRSAAP